MKICVGLKSFRLTSRWWNLKIPVRNNQLRSADQRKWKRLLVSETLIFKGKKTKQDVPLRKKTKQDYSLGVGHRGETSEGALVCERPPLFHALISLCEHNQVELHPLPSVASLPAATPNTFPPDKGRPLPFHLLAGNTFLLHQLRLMKQHATADALFSNHSFYNSVFSLPVPRYVAAECNRYSCLCN